MEKEEARYEITSQLVAAVSLAGVELGKENSQVVEEALRRDPRIAGIIEMEERAGDLPDYDPKRAEKIPA